MSRRIAVALLLVAVQTYAQSRAADDPSGAMDAALDVIGEKFTREIGRTALEQQALRLLLKDLDPYSSYLNADEWAVYESGFSASYGGIGVTLGYPDGAVVPEVGLMLIGSGAAAAGVRRGDSILAIDGHELAGMPFENVITLLRGEPGSNVELTLRRPGSTAPIVVRAERRLVAQPTLRGFRRDAAGVSDYLLDPVEEIGYVRITMLGEETAADVERTVALLDKRGLRGLVLDLRDTPGGMLTQAVRIADLFLDDGVIVTSNTREGRKVIKASPGVTTRAPLVVLANERTASSAEILLAALVDNGRATFVGQRTFGKGRIQEKVALPPGYGGIVITTGTFERPSGKTFDRHDADAAGKAGIVPGERMELLVEGPELDAWREQMERLDGAFILTPDEQRRGTDRVLDRAIGLLRANQEQ